MSKINIEIDTEEETISVSVDGQSVPNVRSISAYASDYGFDAQVVSVEAQGDLMRQTILCASANDNKATSSANFPGLYETQEEISRADSIRAAFARRLGRK